MSFGHRSWRDHDQVSDVRKDVYIRVYKLAAQRRPASPNSFLFTTTRHLLADRARRKRIVSILGVA